MRLVLDWDGTVTERDTLHMAIERFGDLDVFHALEAADRARADAERGDRGRDGDDHARRFDEVLDWLLETVTVPPGVRGARREHDPLIVSAGFRELILPVLEREGVTAEVVANSLEPAASGWRSVFLAREACAVCGEPCKRVALAGAGPFAYVGDGVSDRCVSLAAERVFARDGLARWLDERGAATSRSPTCTTSGAHSTPSGDRATIGGMALLALPQPYDFDASTERFRSLRRRPREPLARRRPAPRRRRAARCASRRRRAVCSIEPCDAAIAGHGVLARSELPLDLDGFWGWAAADPVLAALASRLRGYRPPLVADRWEMLVTSITAQQVSLHSAFAVRSRLIERFGVGYGRGVGVPVARADRRGERERDP